MQFYTSEELENETYAIPDAEVFYRTKKENMEYETLDGDGEPMPSGFYYWFCSPGCLPDSDPIGPFESEEETVKDARENS